MGELPIPKTTQNSCVETGLLMENMVYLVQPNTQCLNSWKQSHTSEWRIVNPSRRVTRHKKKRISMETFQTPRTTLKRWVEVSLPMEIVVFRVKERRTVVEIAGNYTTLRTKSEFYRYTDCTALLIDLFGSNIWRFLCSELASNEASRS